MKRTASIFVLVIVGSVASNATAQTHDHFARQRREAMARQQAQHHLDASHHGLGHWGGTTTTHRYYNPTWHQNVQFYPVHPFGFGIPCYGYGRGGFPYGSPYGAVPGGPGIHIHREIHRWR